MITSQNIEMHPYAGSFAESVAFGDEETSAHPPVYKVNVLAFKHLPRCASRQFSDFGDMNIDDSVHQQVSKPEQKTYKCFKCFGIKTNAKNTIKRNGGQSKCRQCQGSQYISEGHPLVSIMEQIIKKKMPNLPLHVQEENKHENKRQTLELAYGCRDAIKQQSFSYQEQSPPFCRNCNKQCDQNSYRACEICTDFNICEVCFQKKRFSHHHALVFKDASRLPSRISGIPSNIKQVPEQVDMSSSQQYLSDLEMKCSNCRMLIDVCYEVCLDCQSNGIKYCICNRCSQHHLFTHNHLHQFDVRTLTQISELNRLQQSHSVQHQNLELNSISNSIQGDVKRSIVRFNHELMNSSYEENHNQTEFLFEKDSLADSLNFNLADHLFEDDLIIRHKLSNTYHNDGQFEKIGQKKQEKIRNDSSLMGIDLSSSLDIHKISFDEPSSPTYSFVPIFNSYANESIQKQKNNLEQEYIFNDYQCDICGVEPIRNMRYHCTTCQNYDICKVCFEVRSKQHEHRDFQEINGMQLLHQRNSLLKSSQNKIMQLNSTKLKASYDLKKTTK